MLPELHEALKELIYLEGRIDRSEVDIAFEAPTKDFVDKLPRPTIDLYLVEMHENVELRQAQFQASRTNGHGQLRARPKRLDLRYLVTALTTNPEDAFRLLWRAVGVLMRTPELPAGMFPAELHLEAPIVTKVAQPDNGMKLVDVWSAVGTEPRPAFSYVVTVPVDLEMGFEAPLVLTTTVSFKSMLDDRTPERRTFIKGVVRDAAGSVLNGATVAIVGDNAAWTRTNKEGAFVLRTPESGKVRLQITPADGAPHTLEIEVPAKSYDLRIPEIAQTPSPAQGPTLPPSKRGRRRSLTISERTDQPPSR
jgi:archaellin